jgi:hypothetical protein
MSGTAGAAFAPAQWYSNAPVLLAAVQGYRGGDPVALRVLGNDGSSVELVLEEEQSADPETDHADEPVGYLMLRPGELQKP